MEGMGLSLMNADNINSISAIFGRPVTGIHNRTYGVLGDLMECLIQRDLLYSTEDTRLTYNYMKTTLLDPEVKRVVVLAHSQGGIIVSSVIDALYADLIPSAFDKLEIYTFGYVPNRRLMTLLTALDAPLHDFATPPAQYPQEPPASTPIRTQR